MQHRWQRTCVVLWPPSCPGLSAPSRLHLTMTYGFSVLCLLVHQTKSDDFLCFKMKSFGGREETHKDMVNVFSGMFHWEKCFVHIGQHVGFPWSQSCSVNPPSVDGEVSHGGHTVISWMLLDFCGSSFCTLMITRKLLSVPQGCSPPCQSLFSILIPSLISRLTFIYLMNPYVRISVMNINIFGVSECLNPDVPQAVS